MELKKKINNQEKNRWPYWGAIAAAGTFAVAGCDGGGGDSKTESTQTATETTQPLDTTTEQTGLTLTFDDLEGGSPIIQVYPGVEDNSVDRVSNGAYNDDETVVAECKTEGRTVESAPSVGEEYRRSDEWIRIHGTPGETQYATAVYIENPEELLDQLNPC